MNAKVLLGLRQCSSILKKLRWTYSRECFQFASVRSLSASSHKSDLSGVQKSQPINSVWKSSDLTKQNRQILYSKMALDLNFDLKKMIKEETTLYELDDRPAYQLFALLSIF